MDALPTQQVLVVDDDAVFRQFLELQLGMLGCRILALSNGEAAWARILVEPPDLVITDVVMPGMSGIDLCRRIKDTPETGDIPVVLLTMAGSKAKDEGYRAGADDFLGKPPHIKELRTRLHNLLLLKSLRKSASEGAGGLPGGPPPRPPRILVLEAYGILREHVRTLLAAEGWEVQGVDTEARFWAQLDLERPDLAIIDQDLLEGPGTALVAALKRRADTAALPVLLLCEPGALEPGSGAGASEADEHLLKPFEAPELKLRARGLLRLASLRLNTSAQSLASDPAALRDPQSGAYTRAFLLASLDPLAAFAALAGQPVGLLGCRLPRGARSGPVVREAVETLRAVLRPHEILARVDEDLFVLVLPGTALHPLTVRASELELRLPGGRIASIAGSGESAASLLQRLWSQLEPGPESARA